MARISSYNRDELLRAEDQLVISSYEGEGQYGSIYITNNITLDELSNYLNNTFTIGEVNYNLNSMSSSITTNTNALATANVSITTNADSISATATYAVNLASTFGTFDSSGNLTSLSQSFADSILNTSASTDYASASQLTSLTSIVNTQGGTLTQNTSAIATANSGISTNATNIGSSASKVTELESQFTFSGADITGIAGALSTSVSSTVTSATGAVASDLDKLEAVFSFDSNGDVDGMTPGGSLATAVNTSANTAITNASLASAASVTTLTSNLNLKPDIFRQNDAPSVTEAVGSIWFDTNDDNKVYVLVSGSPNVWTESTDGRIALNISSLASANTAITTNSTSISSEAAKITELQSQFTYTGNNISGVNGSESLNTAIDTARSDAESASAAKVDTLGAKFFTNYNNAT